MRRTRKAARRRQRRGSIAVEAALVLLLLVTVLEIPSILYAFYCRQYMAVEKAAHDAAISLSVAPLQEMTTPGPDGNFAALTLARKIVEKELASFVPDGTSVDLIIFCSYRFGGTTKINSCTPTIFKLDAYTLLQFDVAINLPYINPMTGRVVEDMYTSTVVSVRYMGN